MAISYVEKIPNGENITDYLLYRASDEYEKHHTIKTIAQVDKIKTCNQMHYMIYSNGAAVNEDLLLLMIIIHQQQQRPDFD